MQIQTSNQTIRSNFTRYGCAVSGSVKATSVALIQAQDEEARVRRTSVPLASTVLPRVVETQTPPRGGGVQAFDNAYYSGCGGRI